MYGSSEKKFVQSPYQNNSPTETPSRPSTMQQEETHDTEIPNENWSNVKMEDIGLEKRLSLCIEWREVIQWQCQVFLNHEKQD